MNNFMNSNQRIFLIIYIAGVIVTFGHAMNRDFPKNSAPDVNFSLAFVAAPLWPLYWSTVYWEHAGK